MWQNVVMYAKYIIFKIYQYLATLKISASSVTYGTVYNTYQKGSKVVRIYGCPQRSSQAFWYKSSETQHTDEVLQEKTAKAAINTSELSKTTALQVKQRMLKDLYTV